MSNPSWKRDEPGSYSFINVGFRVIVVKTDKDVGGGRWYWELFRWDEKRNGWLSINHAFFNEDTLWEAKDQALIVLGDYMASRRR